MGRVIKKVIIYGAGYYGRKILSTLNRYSDIEIAGYIDANKDGEVYGYPILNLDNLEKQHMLMPVIITMADGIQVKKVYYRLKELGFENIYYYLRKDVSFSHDFFSNEVYKLNDITEKSLIYVEMHLIDYCNLNCQGCTHYSPLFEKKIPDTQRRVKDVERIAQIFDQIAVFAMMGGEPLLSPSIKEYIVSIRRLLPNTELELITNGLLIPSIDSDVLRCIKENKVTIGISEYEPTHKIIDSILARLNEFEIDYFVKEYEKKAEFIRPLSIKENSIYPSFCFSAGCINLWEGKIAKCPSVMYIDKVNEVLHTNLPNEGVIDLNEDINAEELLNRLEQEVPLCKHCVDYRMKWKQCGKEMKLEYFVADK